MGCGSGHQTLDLGPGNAKSSARKGRGPLDDKAVVRAEGAGLRMKWRKAGHSISCILTQRKPRWVGQPRWNGGLTTEDTGFTEGVFGLSTLMCIDIGTGI